VLIQEGPVFVKKLRIYEVAKRVSVASKEVIDFLKKSKIDVVSHMSFIDDSIVKKIEKKFIKKEIPEKKNKKNLLGAGEKLKSSKRQEGEARKIDKVIAPSKKKDSKEVSNKNFLSKKKKKGPVQKNNKAPFLGYVPRGVGGDGNSKVVAVKEARISSSKPLFQISKIFNIPITELVLLFLRKGQAFSRNNTVPFNLIKEVAKEYEIQLLDEKESKESFLQGLDGDNSVVVRAKSDTEQQEASRDPIVVVMGHVDHGKTTFLDFVRKENVAQKEKGGITQHIHACQVVTPEGKILFLDTPGHEAFSYLREKGTYITDLAVLIIAADDGIMPQTKEAIDYIKKTDTPVIVAINKVDLVDNAALESVKGQLAKHDLTPEDWGGDTVVVGISAKTGEGIDYLLEMILLQAELMELRKKKDARGKAFVLETRVEKGLGPVVVAIVIEGSIRQGDWFVCGRAAGRVRILENSSGQRTKQANAVTPVKITGIDHLVGVEEWLHVASQKEYSSVRENKTESFVTAQGGSAFSQIEGENNKYVGIILKADTKGALEAILSAVNKTQKEKYDTGCVASVISYGIGNIIEKDVSLAQNTGAIIVGFNVKLDKSLHGIEKNVKGKIFLYDVIYHFIDDLIKLFEERREKKEVWTKIGEAVVRKVFYIKGAGVVAGCYLREGNCFSDSKVACIRDGKKIGEGKIVSLQREKKKVKEIGKGYEFGFRAEDFSEWKIEDVVECFSLSLE
jgi:translation initiation factor IF-2